MTILDTVTERHFLVIPIRSLEPGERYPEHVRIPEELGAFQLLELQCADPQALQVVSAKWGYDANHNPRESLVTGPPCPLEFMLGGARLPILEAGGLLAFELYNPPEWPGGEKPTHTRPSELVLGGSAWRPEHWEQVGGLA